MDFLFYFFLSEKSPLNRCIFADHVLNPGNQRFHAEDEETEADSSSLAIVPWAPSQVAMAIRGFAGSEPQSQPVHDPMEAEDAEVITSMSTMQVEDLRQATGYSVGGEGFRSQQVLQHCITPQLLPNPNTSSPITWSW